MKLVVDILNQVRTYSRYNAVHIFAKSLSSSADCCMEPTPIHDAVKPLSWILGTWVTENGYGIYPTIKPFNYYEKLTFSTFGQPVINYIAESWNPVNKKPMHFESGFLRMNTKCSAFSFIVAHNFGVATIEEGCLIGGNTTLSMTSKSIINTSFSKPPFVEKTERLLQLKDNGDLQSTFTMKTNKCDHTDHLMATYKKMF